MARSAVVTPHSASISTPVFAVVTASHETTTDVVAASTSGNVVSVWIASGAWTFGTRVDYAATGASAVECADATGDGHRDVIAVLGAGGLVGVFPGAGDGIQAQFAGRRQAPQLELGDVAG